MCASVTVRKRDVSASHLLRVHTRPTFSNSAMVQVVVSKRDCTQLVFVQPGTVVPQSTVTTIETNCRWSYCQQPEASLMKFISFSRTVHRLIVHVSFKISQGSVVTFLR